MSMQHVQTDCLELEQGAHLLVQAVNLNLFVYNTLENLYFNSLVRLSLYFV